MMLGIRINVSIYCIRVFRVGVPLISDQRVYILPYDGKIQLDSKNSHLVT